MTKTPKYDTEAEYLAGKAAAAKAYVEAVQQEAHEKLVALLKARDEMREVLAMKEAA